jgi:WD40 repeat protein
MADLVGERYEPLAVVARGDESEVLRALDHLGGRTVALHVRHLVTLRELDALVSEALDLIDVTRHPNLPLVREHFLLDDSYYLVVDWTPGVGLDRVLKADGHPGLPFERAIDYLTQVAGALEHLHHQKTPVVHQNLEPARLILTDDGRVVPVGFGLSSRWGMSPPPGEPPTPASDVYNLAATAHSLLTGSPPTSGMVPRFTGLSDAEAEGVLRALRRGLDTDPSRRPISPSALVDEIRAGATTLMPPPPTDPWPSEEAMIPVPSPPAPPPSDLWPLETEGFPLPTRPAPPQPALWPVEEEAERITLPSPPVPPQPALWPVEEVAEGTLLSTRAAPPQPALWPSEEEDDEDAEAIPLPTRPAVVARTTDLLLFEETAVALPARPALERAARSSRLRGALVSVLIVLVGVTLLQVRSARAERNEFRRLQLVSVARALAARVDRELAAGHHERAALLARQAGLFNRQTGESVAPEVDRALRAALTAPNFSRVVATAKGGLWSVALSPDGTTLATAGSTVRLVDLGAGPDRGVALSGHIGAVGSLAFSPDGKTLATGGDDPTARLWELSPGTAPAILGGHTDRLTSLAFGFAGQRLATASRDGTVRLWDLGTYPPSASVLSGHTGAVTAVAFSADGARLATGGEDGQVRIWDVVQPAVVATLPAGTGVAAVAFSPDGRQLATGSQDRFVRLWDLGQPGAPPQMLAGHGGPVSTVAFSADGSTLASGSEDATVRLWTRAGQPGAVLIGHNGPVTSVAFGPSEALASASADGTARLWQLGEPPGASTLRADPEVDNAVLADLVCQEVGRNLSPQEWQEFVGPGVAYQRTCPDLPRG